MAASSLDRLRISRTMLSDGRQVQPDVFADASADARLAAVSNAGDDQQSEAGEYSGGRWAAGQCSGIKKTGQSQGKSSVRCGQRARESPQVP